MRRLRAAVIGHGSMGAKHLASLRRSQEFEVCAVVDRRHRNPDASHPVRIAAFPDLVGRAPDLAILALPVQLQPAWAIALADARIPTLIEKPVALDTTAAREIATAFRRSQTPAAAGYVERFCPAAIATRDAIAAGVIGDIMSVSAVRLGPEPRRDWSVNAALDLMSHDLDLVAWLAGQRLARHGVTTPIKPGGHLQDARLTARLATGTPADFRAGHTQEVTRHVTVTGSRGALLLDTKANTLAVARRGVSVSQIVGGPEPLVGQHQAFAKAIQGHQNQCATLADAVRVLAALSDGGFAGHGGPSRAATTNAHPGGLPRAANESDGQSEVLGEDGPVARPVPVRLG